MNIVEKQSGLNRSTSGQWHLYASHRQELERLLVPAAPGGRICVLGAGNCNDLDLRWLTQVYREVQLVDIDGEALERAAKFQQVLEQHPCSLAPPQSVILRYSEGSGLSGEPARSFGVPQDDGKAQQKRTTGASQNSAEMQPFSSAQAWGEGGRESHDENPHLNPRPEYREREQETKALSNGSLRLRGSIDLTGLADRLGKWKQALPDAEEIRTSLRLASTSPAKLAKELGGPFDVVLSPCVLSQLLMPLHDTIGRAHPAFGPMLAAMRARHFRLMLDLLSPGGRGVFACDILSSVAVPDLARVPKDQLSGVIQNMLAGGKCFSGLESAAIADVFARDPSISPQIGQVQTAPPWLWHLGLSKTYAVYGMTFVKREPEFDSEVAEWHGRPAHVFLTPKLIISARLPLPHHYQPAL